MIIFLTVVPIILIIFLVVLSVFMIKSIQRKIMEKEKQNEPEDRWGHMQKDFTDINESKENKINMLKNEFSDEVKTIGVEVSNYIQDAVNAAKEEEKETEPETVTFEEIVDNDTGGGSFNGYFGATRW